ncbi:MAG: hypothetical protein ACTHLO_01075 [Pseudolabrys sp.]
MRNSKQFTVTAAAIAVVTFIALGTTAAVAAPGNVGPGRGDATQTIPTQDNCMQSPASTSYTPCWNNG